MSLSVCHHDLVSEILQAEESFSQLFLTQTEPLLPFVTSHVQNIKSVQSVGGVSGSQFKTIIPLPSQPNVQQIQVPGSRFHYVRLVTATTASGVGQTSGPSTSSIQTGDC